MAAASALWAPEPDLHQAAVGALSNRRVTDSRGRVWNISIPFRGAVSYAGIVMPNYLLVTQAPDSLINSASFGARSGLSNQLLSRIFPAYARHRGTLDFRSGTGDIEQMLAVRPSAVLVWESLAEHFESFGLPAVSVRNTQKESEILDCVRIYAELNGTPERAKTLIDSARKENAELARELGPLTDSQMPRVLALYLTADNKILGSFGAAHVANTFWARGGARSAFSASRDAMQLDAEKVLQLNPDVILLEGPASPTPAQFALDPRWVSLRAVHERRVYKQPRGLDGFMWNIVDNPLLSRWFAELLHPDRVKPELRAKMKESYERLMNYQASEADLDEALSMAENRNSAGYERFAAQYGGAERGAQ
jgi:iron complex transport system substrate-binding protein